MDRQPLTDRLGDRLLAEYGGAAAAYSLRALNGNGDSVVRVRRASDNDEKDFTAEQIELGEMVNWVNEQITPPLDLRELTATGRDGPIIEAAAAYSLRNLSTTYTGNVVDVRRSSDDAEESFTAAEVSDGTLTDWVGAGNDGHVSKWYDQSGNDNHATQGTPASQPKIVDGGSLVSGGIDFDGVDDELSVGSTVITSSSLFGAAVVKHNTGIIGETSEQVWGQYAAGSSGRFFLNANPSNLYAFFADATNSASGLTAGAIGTSQTLLTSNLNGSMAEIWRDGVSQNTDDYSGFTPSTESLSIGKGGLSTDYFNGNVAEIIIYNSDQSDNRTAIEANIGETYGITGIPAYDNTVDGFVETWYDQSGNGNDATQSVAEGQPKIVDGGTLVTTNGNPTVDFYDNCFLDTDAFLDGSAHSSFAAINNQGATSTRKLFYTKAEFPNKGFTWNYRGDQSVGQYDLVSYNGIVNSLTFSNSTSPLHYVSSLLINSTKEVFINGNSVATSSDSFVADDETLGIGSLNFGTGFDIQELIIYPSDQTANRPAIETNINNHYSIYA